MNVFGKPLVALALLCLAREESSFHVKAQTIMDTPYAYFGGNDYDVYESWLNDRGVAAYSRSAWFPSLSDENGTTGVAVHWSMGEDGQDPSMSRIYLAVAARATSWLGFGLSENGGMHGADVVYLETSRPDRLVDAHILDVKYPEEDDCQNWKMVQAPIIEDGFIIFEASRLLDTGDLQDRIFAPDADPTSVATLVIAAWGDGDDGVMAYHGAENRVRGQLRFHQSSLDLVGPSFQELMNEQAEGSFVLTAHDYAVSTEETQYTPFCNIRQDMIDQGVPMDNENLILIGFEPIVDPRSVAHVHHFTVTSRGNDDAGCASDDVAVLGESSVYGWAPGETPFVLPENVGLPFGDAAGATSLRMVIHYDNPQGVANVLDSSGVRYYYTTQPREHTVGSTSYGDTFVRLQGQPVGQGYVAHTFDCPSSCTTFALTEPVTVFRQYMHMHKKGVSARMLVLRDGEIAHESTVHFFAFDQQGNQVVQQESFQILPGDSLRVQCEYHADEDEGLQFGFASSDEMCLVNLWYYPQQTILNGRLPWACPHDIPLDACSSTHSFTSLPGGVTDLSRQFGYTGDLCLTPETDDNLFLVETAAPSVSSAGEIVWFLPRGAWFFVAFIACRRAVGSKNLVIPLFIE